MSSRFFYEAMTVQDCVLCPILLNHQNVRRQLVPAVRSGKHTLVAPEVLAMCNSNLATTSLNLVLTLRYVARNLSFPNVCHVGQATEAKQPRPQQRAHGKDATAKRNRVGEH